MIVETRKTAQGTEYWDNKEKRSLFVPAGKKPSFEITKDPESMVLDVDLASGKDKTVVNGGLFKREHLGEWVGPDWDEMDTEQLLEYAKQRDIKVPGNIKKEETIRRYIDYALNKDTDTNDSK